MLTLRGNRTLQVRSSVANFVPMSALHWIGAALVVLLVGCADTGGRDRGDQPLPSTLDLVAGSFSRPWRIGDIRSTDPSGLIVKFRYRRTEGNCQFDDTWIFFRDGRLTYETGASLCYVDEQGFTGRWQLLDDDTRMAVQTDARADTFNFRTARNELLLTDADGWIYRFETAQ